MFCFLVIKFQKLILEEHAQMNHSVSLHKAKMSGAYVEPKTPGCVKPTRPLRKAPWPCPSPKGDHGGLCSMSRCCWGQCRLFYSSLVVETNKT